MHRLFRLSFLVMLFGIFLIWEADAQRPQQDISGKIEPTGVRILVKDTTYIVNGRYVVAGTLIIEPGTTILFAPNGRLIDSVGGRIIADGFSKSLYNRHPDGIIPLPGHSTNLIQKFTGYYDLRYFAYRSATDQTVKWTTDREKTIHKNKYNLVYNLLLDTIQRKISTPIPGTIPTVNQIWISYEEAIMFTVAKLHAFDPVNNLYPLDSVRLSLKENKINFIGQPYDNFSREWGHIVILPGAGISFFRNCTFDGFRKDTTVDRTKYYGYETFANHGNWMDLAPIAVDNLNNQMRVLTNGSGGAITTFSSRTWLIDCEFKNNMARHRGGAVQFLQAPNGFPKDAAYAFAYYPLTKNPNITERNGAPSTRNALVPVIDYIDEQFAEPNLASGPLAPFQYDFARQAYDDGRMSIYLGRFRNVTFTNNKVLLSNIGQKAVGNPPVLIITDLDDQAKEQKDGRNTAAGGAMFIYGSNKLEIGLGVNNGIYIKDPSNKDTLLTFNDDTFKALNNNATTYQPIIEDLATQQGAVGGAIYVGNIESDINYFNNDATSLIVAGELKNNSTVTPYINEDLNELDEAADFSKGGAIYTNSDNGDARLQVRGGPARVNIDNETVFSNNTSGVGGAIYVEANLWGIQQSPVLGGHDVKDITAQLNDYPRDYGFNVLFENNSARYFGGAIYTERPPVITGAGGVDGLSSMGYGGVRFVRFLKNTARYSGGAINVDLSMRGLLPENRAIQIIRAEFIENTVGINSAITTDNKPLIRGGGAIYSVDADINLVKATEFRANKVMNGNGAAIAIVRPQREIKRFFLTDLDNVVYDPNPAKNNLATNFVSNDDVFTFKTSPYPAQTGMLTRFLDNEIMVEDDVLAAQSGSGTTQVEIPGTLVRNVDLYGIHFLNQETGFAAGENGTIMKITEEGTKWEYVEAPVSSLYTDITFVTNNIGFATSKDGFLVKTTDGGLTWGIVAWPGKSINSIAFNGSKGAMVGDDGLIMGTNDGGSTWSSTILGNAVPPNFTEKDLYGIFWADADNLWLVGSEGTIIKVSTLNGWEYVTSNTFNDLHSLYFVNANVGYIVGEGAIVLKTTNGGISWEGDYRPENVDFYKVSFKLNIGFIIGENGIVLQTTDAGETWAQQVSNTEKGLFDIFFVTPQLGYMVGENELVEGTTYNSGLMITRDGGATWNKVITSDTARLDVRRYHPHPMVNLPENGIGLGGAIYVLDIINANRALREDSVRLNRVRFQNNKAYSGAAVYSDNYNLNFILTRCLVTGNEALENNNIGLLQNAITGPYIKNPLPGITEKNEASSDLAGAIFYANVMGPLPANTSSISANSIYDNNARFLFRLPDAPNTKGVIVGTSGIGYGGIDTLRSNYWGHTEANVNMVISNVHGGWANAIKETFFVATDNQNHLKYIWWDNANPRMDLLEQGPFESINRFNYQPIPLVNEDGDENTPAFNSIPEKLLMSGFVYDIYDKGTDIKTADYSNRRMSPIEDFAVGIPPKFELYSNPTQPSNGRYIKRYTRDPFVAEMRNENSELKYPLISELQGEFKADANGVFYHPVGYPLFLETKIDYEGFIEVTNHDPRAINETVFFVINETTGDYIRVNMKQFSEDAILGLDEARSIFRARVELVPDSTNRSSSVIKPGIARRIAEGLPTYGSLFQLLDSLNRNPYNEDAATLQGRKYFESTNSFANKTNLFSNRPSMPASDRGKQTFFAGERYGALPVNVGDSIFVVSRSYLWQYGPTEALKKGMQFVVSGSVNPPDYTGDIPALEVRKIIDIVPSKYPWKRDLGIPDTIWNDDFMNKIFLTENRNYPVRKGAYSDYQSIYYLLSEEEQENNLNPGDMEGRDSILAVTAKDLNNFIDPMSLIEPDNYTNLSYKYKFNPDDALMYWFWAKMIPSSGAVKDEASGWMQFNGKPINPFVVPEGEFVTVRVDNYPPHWRTIDKLKELSGLDADYISKFINIFKPYLNAPLYTDYLARFLQADTIDVGSHFFSREYKFNVNVVNIRPKFLPYNSPRNQNATAITIPNKNVTRQQLANNNFIVDKTTTVVDTIYYQDSWYTCGITSDGKLVANVTDKLRFQADFNTDDEMEDAFAEKSDWEFPYGRTNYSLIDKPNWMNNQYLYKYDSDTEADLFGVDLTTYAKLNIRIPANEAKQLLKPINQYNGYLVNDTIFTILAEDGHAGLTSLDIRLFINYAPEITTNALPDAKEDFEYNPGLLDSSKMIKVFDANFGQEHKFELVYSDYPYDQLDKDPCYAEAGTWDLTGLKTTPKWLKINETNGFLYGTPGINDAPKDEKVTVVVWDIIDGDTKIPVVKTFDLYVDSTNHPPVFVSSPEVQCIDYGKPYTDHIIVSDRDLLRADIQGRTAEELTVTVLQPTSGLSVQFIDGGKSQQDEEFDTIKVWTDNFNLPRDSDGKITIKIEVKDKANNKATLVYRLKMSDITNFVATLKVENSRPDGDTTYAFQLLEFGTANPQSGATTGDNSDNNGEGVLDYNFCEFELPPIPNQDIFDARWQVPKTNGILRNIYPKGGTNEGSYVYRAIFQAGGEKGNTGIYYPVRISWNKTEIPARIQTNDPSWVILDAISTEGNYFRYNMNTGEGKKASDIQYTQNGDICTIVITTDVINAFRIKYDWISDVEQPVAGFETGITSISPNPFDDNTNINFEIGITSNVKIEVIDQLGNVLAVVTENNYAPGQYSINWNANNLSSGTYTCRMIAGSVTSAYKMIIVK